MKILEALPFNEREKKLLVRVFVISSGLCLLSIAAALTATVLTQSGSSATPVFEDTPQSLDISRIDIEAHRFAARHHLRSNSPEKAVPHLHRVLAKDGTDREARYGLATAHIDAGHVGRALSLLRELHEEQKRDSLSFEIHASYGLALLRSGAVKECISELDLLLAHRPENARALCYRGMAAASLGAKNAEGYFKKAVAQNPDFSEALYQLARFRMNSPRVNREEYLAAKELLLGVLRQDPLHARSHARLGMIHYYLGQADLAKKSYQIALTLNPQDYNSRYSLGVLYEELFEDPGAALKEYARALKSNPDHVEANFRAGLIFLSNDMFNEAIRHLERARRSSPEKKRILLQLAVAYERKDMRREALAVYRKVCEIDPLDEVARQKFRLLSLGDQPVRNMDL